MLTHSARGFSLVEFMIAITVSLILLAALTSTFVANSRARTELDRSNQQIENGRYANAVLADALQLAGFLGEFNSNTAVLLRPLNKSRPCATTVPEWIEALRLHVQGYDNIPDADADGKADIADIDQDGTAATDLDCLPVTDVRPGTDVLVVRHASHCVSGSPNCPAVPGAPYFQAANCGTQIAFPAQTDPATPGIANSRQTYRLDTVDANLNRTLLDCATRAPQRRYLVRIYFVANNDLPNDGIPTLKLAELTGVGGAPAFEVVSLANGIENFQVEYGIDCSVDAGAAADCNGDGAADLADGAPDAMTANPDLYNRADPLAPFATCAANPDCIRNWTDVTSIKLSILARNLEPSRDHVDRKVYTLGQNVDRDPQCALAAAPPAPRPEIRIGDCFAFADGYRRHVYQSVIRLNNPAIRRE